MQGHKKEVYVISNGCHESYMDAAFVQDYFKKRPNFSLVENYENADLILILGCSVMQKTEDETRELIKLINQRKHKHAKLVVAGCISKVRPEFAMQDAEYAGLLEEINSILRLKKGEQEINANFPYRPYRGKQGRPLDIVRTKMRNESISNYAPGFLKIFSRLFPVVSDVSMYILSRYADFVESRLDVWNERTYTIKISTGCLGNCSYCSIKQARGKISSRQIQIIVSEVKNGLELGYHDYALIGTDIGDYGNDFDTNLLELLKAIILIPGRFQLRLRNVNPRWLIPNAAALCEILKSGKIGYIQSPIQSGSDRILKLMNRGYLARDYLVAIERIRKSSPEVFIKTQVIVGFPCESEEDFRDSLRLYGSGLFNYIDVFSYSNRPNTKASMMSGQIPEEVILRRRRKLLVKSIFQLAPKQLLLQLLTPSKSVN